MATGGLPSARGVDSMAAFGPVIEWVSDHRVHHAPPTRPSVHSPHVPGRGPLRGFGTAHVGWLFAPRDTRTRGGTPDLLEDRGMRVINSAFGPS